jgi:riboflavin synthase
MFTGLVEALAKLVACQPQGTAVRLDIDLKNLIEGVSIGDSIAINGCCLTVVALDGTIVSFEAGSETLAKTGLGRLGVDDQVNIERSLRVGDRLGGHFVTGHIDGQGRLAKKRVEGDWAFLYFEAPSQQLKQMASKGSIAIDGVSLTLVDVDNATFSVALIPHTLAVTTLGKLQVGDSVNLETDILAKYVQRLAHANQ